MKLKLFGIKKGLPIMEEKENKVLQGVMLHIIRHIKILPLAEPLAQTQICTNCASGSCLQPSLQLHTGLQAVCKGNISQYQAHANSFVCSFVCRNLKLTKA